MTAMTTMSSCVRICATRQRQSSRFSETQGVQRVRTPVFRHGGVKLARSGAFGTFSSSENKPGSFSPKSRNIKRTGNVINAASTAVAETGDESEENSGPTLKTQIIGLATMAVLGFMWYGGNIYFNILNKQVLKAFMYPISCTCVYLGVNALAGVIGWTTGVLEKPQLKEGQLKAFLPMALFHTMGNLLMMMSLGMVAVSFTHTIKACEPFFLVATSATVLGQLPSINLMLSLVPIVLGVSIASMTELSFNWLGFWTAIGSNVASALRNTYSKNYMGDKRGDLSSLNLLTIISAQSCLMCIPIALYFEGLVFLPSSAAMAGLDYWKTVSSVIVAGAMMTLYQQTSYSILAKCTPVTHSVMNSVKRVAVIVASVLFFRNPVGTRELAFEVASALAIQAPESSF
ncbi:hypothetical protein CYMTET_3599 [Cymbomonas tetramitiformis]|uniref:Sugar phosphate transporter domain-containing protein n=1 Tax=Cymbomonas tetramitiformis TaxID=36881 RepID=A0AAE0H2Z7_9CHLO|nr:hypothetical protein CYMTET_3599 [Cymbomonas tetramitiformis]